VDLLSASFLFPLPIVVLAIRKPHPANDQDADGSADCALLLWMQLTPIDWSQLTTSAPDIRKSWIEPIGPAIVVNAKVIGATCWEIVQC
jgi:hypothetical protein